MKSWKSKTSGILMMVMVLCLIGFVGNVSAAKFAKQFSPEVIALGHSVVTSMTIQNFKSEAEGEVKEITDIDDAEDLIIYKLNTSDGSYYYFFNKDTTKLMYGLYLYDISYKEELMSDLREQCGQPIESENDSGNLVYFYKYGGIGYKVMPYDDDSFQLWVGSIKLWNDFVEDNPEFREFQE